jgi:hypothetical protein
MSTHVAFRRAPVPAQLAQQLQAISIPAPTNGLTTSQNLSAMTPGSAIIHDNWKPTLQGVALRGGCLRWCELPETTPVISAFEYTSANVQKMFAGNATKLYDVTANGTPTLVKSGQTSGNYCASQMANASGDYLMVVNDAGDFPLRFDGSTWTVLNSNQITGPPGSTVVDGENLTYVWKYRNRWFFIEGGSMNAWYLPIDAIEGALAMIPLSGAASKGGKLLFGATWSLDAGDGIGQKCVFATDMGEIIVFSGTDPSTASNWQQEGLYSMSPPMGMNAHLQVGADLLVATIDGIIPVSQAISKDVTILDMAAITMPIRSMWRDEVAARRTLPWTMKKWDEYGGIFVTWPGGLSGQTRCAAFNNGTNAWTRFTGWDAMCFIRMRENLFFGTQDGIIMQADQTGTDDGKPYVATLALGWSVFQGGAAEVTWHQARATFRSDSGEPFLPQLASMVDYLVQLPPAPPSGQDQAGADVWDQGLWDVAKWDQAAPPRLAEIRNTYWVSIGMTGYSHSPVVQVTVSQRVKPDVELIAIGATYETLGVNV